MRLIHHSVLCISLKTTPLYYSLRARRTYCLGNRQLLMNHAEVESPYIIAIHDNIILHVYVLYFTGTLFRGNRQKLALQKKFTLQNTPVFR